MNGIEIWKIYQRSWGVANAGDPWRHIAGFGVSSDTKGTLLEYRLAATQVALAFGWVSETGRSFRSKTTNSLNFSNWNRCPLVPLYFMSLTLETLTSHNL